MSYEWQVVRFGSITAETFRVIYVTYDNNYFNKGYIGQAKVVEFVIEP